jgi:hypothetical protein
MVPHGAGASASAALKALIYILPAEPFYPVEVLFIYCFGRNFNRHLFQAPSKDSRLIYLSFKSQVKRRGVAYEKSFENPGNTASEFLH